MTTNGSSGSKNPFERPREQWTGQATFIIAAIGSAVGLGNIWRFPGVAYENGGGAFLIPYLVALLTAGIPILFLDYALGHRYRGSAPTSLRRLSRKAEGLGWFQVMIAFIIAIYYTAVIAWAVSFFVFSFDLRWGDDPGGFFQGEYLQASEPGFSLEFVPSVLIPLVGVWIVALIVLGAGVVRGIQAANIVFIPLLVVAFGALVVRALFLDGATEGLNAFFTPEWDALGDPNVWIAAYAQIFFSLSIAFGIMITYASYRRRKSNMTSPGLVVAFSNSSFELLAGIGVFSTLGFMAARQGIVVGDLEGLTGVGLSFVTFPAIISEMPGGQVVGALFFGSLTMAGFTSLISILQVVSAGFQEKFGLSRTSATIGIGVVATVLSVGLFATTTGLFALDTIDNWANNIGVVASAVIMAIVVIWLARGGRVLRFHLNSVSTFKVGTIWQLLLGLLVPIVLGYMLIQQIINLINDGYEGYPTWYLNTFGWGTIGVLIVGALILWATRWRHNPDDFVPWPVYRGVDAPPPPDPIDGRTR